MLDKFKSSKLMKYGLPFLILVIGGSFGLKEFTNIRYSFHKRRIFVKELEKSGLVVKPPSEVTLDKAFEEIQEIDTTNWENKRGPRPWEEDNVLYLESLERRKKMEEKERKGSI